MKISKALTLLAVIAVLSNAGCATLLKSKTTQVQIDKAPSGAEVTVDGKNVGTAPVSVALSNKTDHQVTFINADGKETSCRIAAGASTGWVVLGILAGGVGWIVDWATANWRNLDTSQCSTAAT